MSEALVDVRSLLERPIALSCAGCFEHVYTYTGGLNGINRQWETKLVEGRPVPFQLSEDDVSMFFPVTPDGSNAPARTVSVGSPLKCTATEKCHGLTDLSPLLRARELAQTIR